MAVFQPTPAVPKQDVVSKVKPAKHSKNPSRVPPDFISPVDGKKSESCLLKKGKTEVAAAAKGRGIPSHRDFLVAIQACPSDGKKNATGRGIPSRRELLAAVQACPSYEKKSATGRTRER